MVTTAESRVVTIVNTGTYDLFGVDVFAFITDEGEALPVVISEIGGFNTVFADMTTNPATAREPDGDYINVIRGFGGEYEVINPQLLPILAELGMDFNSSSHGVALRDQNGTLLTDKSSSECYNGGTSEVYAETWEESEGQLPKVQFADANEGFALNCALTAFNQDQEEVSVVFVRKSDTPVPGGEFWQWENLAAYYLEAIGVPSSIIPVYQP